MNPSEADKTHYIYWEKQGTDRLCGVHCLNSLLQGPFFDEIQLGFIAQDLDAEEQALFFKEFSEPTGLFGNQSNNVADDGNYSIQVIAEALKRTNDLFVESIKSVNVKNSGDLCKKTGFICNSKSHWFSIRKVNDKWYNLNSTNIEGPEFISDFYLDVFLESVRAFGYTIFAVEGEFPETNKEVFSDLQNYQFWFSESDCMALHQKNFKKKNYKLNCNGTDERDLELALENSKKDFVPIDDHNLVLDDPIATNSKPSADQGKPAGDQEKPATLPKPSATEMKALEAYFKKFKTLLEDPELSFVMMLSMKEAFNNRPKADENHFNLNFRFPNGSTSSFTFHKTTPIETLYDFAKVTLPEEDRYIFTLSIMYPRKQLANLNLSVFEAGIQDNETVIIEKLP